MTFTQQPSHFKLVGEFHYVFDHPKRSTPYIECFDDEKLMKLRVSLIDEENKEFKDAFRQKDICEMVDALGDLIYVINGAGHVLGIDLDYMLWFFKINISTDISRVKSVTPESLDIDHIQESSLMFIDRHIELFKKAIENRNLQKVAEHLTNLLQCVYDLGHEIGFNMNAVFREIHRANMTKTCSIIEDAEASVTFYLKEGRYKNPKFVQKDSYYVIVADDGKILKNHKWQPPNIAKFI